MRGLWDLLVKNSEKSKIRLCNISLFFFTFLSNQTVNKSQNTANTRISYKYVEQIKQIVTIQSKLNLINYYLRITRKKTSEFIEVGVDSLPPPLLRLFMILQGGKCSILRRRIRQSCHLQRIIWGATTEALHPLKLADVCRVTVRANVHDSVSGGGGDEAVEVVLVFRLMHAIALALAACRGWWLSFLTGVKWEKKKKSVGSFRWGFVFRVFYLSEFWVLVALLFFDYNNVVEEKVDKIFSHET